MLSESAIFEATSSQPVTSKVTHIGPPTYDVNAAGPWWLNLDPDFYRSSEQFEMRFGERFKVMTTGAAGEVFKTLTATLLAAAIGPGSTRSGEFSSWEGDDNIYIRAAINGDPSVLFGDPPKGVRIRTSKARGLHFRPKRGFRQRLRFESPYQPLDDSVRKRFSDKRNRIAHALHWRHKDKPRPTIIGIHGFNADPFTVNQQLFALPWFYQLGCDVMLFTLPFHGARRPHRSLFSGPKKNATF